MTLCYDSFSGSLHLYSASCLQWNIESSLWSLLSLCVTVQCRPVAVALSIPAESEVSLSIIQGTPERTANALITGLCMGKLGCTLPGTHHCARKPCFTQHRQSVRASTIPFPIEFSSRRVRPQLQRSDSSLQHQQTDVRAVK